MKSLIVGWAVVLFASVVLADTKTEPAVPAVVATPVITVPVASEPAVRWPKEAVVRHLCSVRYWRPQRIRDTIAVLEDPLARQASSIQQSEYAELAYGLKIFLANTSGETPILDEVSLAVIFSSDAYSANSPLLLLLPAKLAADPAAPLVLKDMPEVKGIEPVQLLRQYGLAK